MPNAGAVTGKWSCHHGNRWQGSDGREARQGKGISISPICNVAEKGKALRQSRCCKVRQLESLAAGLRLCATGPRPQVWWAKGERCTKESELPEQRRKINEIRKKCVNNTQRSVVLSSVMLRLEQVWDIVRADVTVFVESLLK